MGKGWAGLLQSSQTVPAELGWKGKGGGAAIPSLLVHTRICHLWSEGDGAGGSRDPPETPPSLTHAVDPGVVQVVAEGALAAEGAVGVDAGAVDAHAQVLRALVHVWKGKMKPQRATNSPGPSGLTGEGRSGDARSFRCSLLQS